MIDFFMDPLRLTLIIAGVVVLLAIVIFSRRSGKRKDFTYTPSPAKEFSFGSSDISFNDETPKDILIDDGVVSPARVQKQDDLQQPQINVDTTQEKQDVPQVTVSNAYNVRTEPKSQKTTVNEFQAYQKPLVDEPIKNDVFDEDGIGAVRVVKKAAVEEVSPEPVKAEPRINTETAKVTNKPITQKAVKPASSSAQPAAPKKPAVKERFIVLHVIATEGKPFNGLDILESTKTLGLAFGKHAIFHYPMSAAPAGDSKFCLVNMSPDGNFETNKLSSLETNGVSLIMRLPIRGSDPLTVFSNMLGVAQALARKLGGEILDQTRVPLTAEIVSTIRADIAQFENSLNQSTTKEPVPEV